MVDSGIDLLALADFRLVAAHGGFGRAARESGRSKATLSRRVRELEVSLGRRLLERTGTTVSLTDDGRTLLANVEGPLDELDTVGDVFRVGGSEPYGHLRISVPLVPGHYALGHLAERFREAHPRLALEMVCEDRYVDLLREGYHAAIRVNPQPDDDLVGRLFLRERLYVVAPAHFVFPELESDDSEVPAVVRVSGWDATPWRLRADGRSRILRPKPVLRMSTVTMIRDSVLAGAGAALLPGFLIREHLASGRLRQWGLSESHEIEVWIVHASRRLVSSKVRALIDFLLQAFPEQSFEATLERIRA